MQTKQTKPTKISQIERAWHLINAKDEVLGRLSTKIATLLTGKNKPYFVSNLDCGDHVVVINADKIKVTGNKETQLNYYSYSGYPGGLKETRFDKMIARKPEYPLTHAVKGMVPKNRLGQQIIKKLHVYAGNAHPYENMKFVNVAKAAK